MRWIPAIFATIVAVFGGAYIGSFSCGSPQWPEQSIIALLAALIVATIAVPVLRSRPLLSKAIIPFGVATLFVVSRAAAAPFYPTAPNSVSAFFKVFTSSLFGSVC